MSALQSVASGEVFSSSGGGFSGRGGGFSGKGGRFSGRDGGVSGRDGGISGRGGEFSGRGEEYFGSEEGVVAVFVVDDSEFGAGDTVTLCPSRELNSEEHDVAEFTSFVA